jgi:hypothetical protein
MKSFHSPLLPLFHNCQFRGLDSIQLQTHIPVGWRSETQLFTSLYVKVKVKVTLRLTVSQSVILGVELHLGLMTRYLLLFDSYGLVFVGLPSLTRGRVCLVEMLLALARAVFLGSESLGTRDHILLSQI